MSFLCKWFRIVCPKPKPPAPQTPVVSDRWLSVDVGGVTEFSARLILDSGSIIEGQRVEPSAPWHISFRIPGNETGGYYIHIVPSNPDFHEVHARGSINGVSIDVLGRIPATHCSNDPLQCERKRPVRRSQQELTQVMANFCNLKDSKGRVVFTAFLPSLPVDERKEWYELQRQYGSTHIAISPKVEYGGSPIPAFDLLKNIPAFAEIVREILHEPSADGKAFTPIIILDGGEPDIKSRINTYWAEVRHAIGDDQMDCIVVPGWELITASSTTSAEYSYALETLHRHGWTHIWAHLSQGRASCASNPVEPDDPWAGTENCWTSHGGQYVEGMLFQADTTIPNDDELPLPAAYAESAEGWLNRWNDVLPRVGLGWHGWRRMHLCFFESPAYYYYRGQSDTAFCRRIATKAKQLADKYGVAIGFGNGLPY